MKKTRGERSYASGPRGAITSSNNLPIVAALVRTSTAASFRFQDEYLFSPETVNDNLNLAPFFWGGGG
jgi:hypothetical protein